MEHSAAVGGSSFQRLESKLNGVMELMAAGIKLSVVSYPSLLWSLYSMNRLSRSCLQTVREKMSWCSEYCETGACLARIYQDVSLIRNNYLRIMQDLVPRLPLPSLLKKRLADSLDDWDDLAEDCYIGMDKEVRSLLSEIANAVRNHSYASV